MVRPRSAKLRLRHVELFHWIMSTGTVTGAAAAMGSSQPTISRDLAQMETIIGKPLFLRDNRRLEPTAEARILYAEVEKSYSSVDQLHELAGQVFSGAYGLLRIACVPSIALNLVPTAIHLMAGKAPYSTFELEVHSRDSILELLRSRAFDVAFTVLGGDTVGLNTTYLATVDAVCVFHASSPLAALDVVRPQDVAQLPFISLAERYMSRWKVDEVMIRAGVQPKTLITTQTAISACGVIRMGTGVTIIDPLTAAAARDDSVLVRPFLPRVQFDYVAAVPNRDVNRPLVEGMIELVRQEFDALAKVDCNTSGVSPGF